MTNIYDRKDIKIIIIDDYDLICKAIKRGLEAMQFSQISICHNGSDALKTIDNDHFDLILLDLNLPDISGLEILKYVRNRKMNYDIPTIVLTGDSDRDNIVLLSSLNIDEYMLKPFDKETLENKILKVLNSYSNPSKELKLLRNAEKEFLKKRIRSATLKFEKILQEFSNSARAIHGHAMCLNALGQEEKALDILLKAIKYLPSYHKMHATISNIYIKLKNTQGAISSLTKELNINPKQPKRQAILGQLLLKNNSPKKAKECFRNSLIELPNNETALLGMISCNLKLANLDKALYYNKRLRRYHPKNEKSFKQLVNITKKMGVPQIAEHLIKDEIQAKPKHLNAYSALVNIYYKQKKYDKALDLIQKGLRIDASYESLLKLEIKIQKNSPTIQENILRLKNIITLTPNSINYTNYGIELLKVGKTSKAVQSFYKALSYDNNNSEAVFYLAQSHLQEKYYLKAFFLFKRFLNLSTTNKKEAQNKCQFQLKQCQNKLTRRARRQEQIKFKKIFAAS